MLTSHCKLHLNLDMTTRKNYANPETPFRGVLSDSSTDDTGDFAGDFCAVDADEKTLLGCTFGLGLGPSDGQIRKGRVPRLDGFENLLFRGEEGFWCNRLESGDINFVTRLSLATTNQGNKMEIGGIGG
jgi:hypothetical protein